MGLVQLFCQQVLLIHFLLGAVGRCALSGAPIFGQVKPVVGGNHRTDRLVQLLFRDMVLIDPGDLPAAKSFERPGSL